MVGLSNDYNKSVTGRRSSTWQHSVMTTALPSTPRRPKSESGLSEEGEKGWQTHPIHINGTEVEHVFNFSQDLSWSLNTSRLFNVVQQLKKALLSPQILANFYNCINKSILTNCIRLWYGSCSVKKEGPAIDGVNHLSHHLGPAPCHH